MEKYLLGVDVGGTTVKIGIFTEQGDILEKWQITTQVADKSALIPHDIWNSIVEKMKNNKIKQEQLIGMGVGAPGFVSSETGEIALAVNLGWKDFPLGDILKDLSGLPVYVENDANIAALGENWLGSGQLSDHLIAVTLGTGVGAGIIANGKVISGTNGTAGEIGHVIVDKDGAPCNCGRRGCLETITSATGIGRIAMEKVKTRQESKLADIYKYKEKISSKDVFNAYADGDELATEVVEEITDVLGLAIANIATTLNPAKIVIGGGVSKAGDLLLNPLKKAYKKYTLPRTYEGSSFAIAELENDAGIIGGAYLVKQNQA